MQPAYSNCSDSYGFILRLDAETLSETVSRPRHSSGQSAVLNGTKRWGKVLAIICNAPVRLDLAPELGFAELSNLISDSDLIQSDPLSLVDLTLSSSFCAH